MRLAGVLAAFAALASNGCAGGERALVPVNEGHARSLMAPLRLGWLSSDRETGALPSAIALGGSSGERVLLYLEFPEPDGGRPLVQAELLLRPVGRAGLPVDVEVSRADAAGASLRHWSDQPRALYPRLEARVVAREWPVRIDVTEIVRASSKRGEPLRLLLRAEPSEGEGVAIATGAAGGEAPKLALYYR